MQRSQRPLGILPVLLGFLAGCHAPAGEPSAPAREAEPSPAGEKAQSRGPKAAAPPLTEKSRVEDAVVIRGTIEAIRMHNINKALGHYTYNVEIELRHEGVEHAGSVDPATVPNPLVVRVDKVFFREMSQAERDAVAPDGPQQELRPPRWKDLALGQTVELEVTFTSASLAHRVK